MDLCGRLIGSILFLVLVNYVPVNTSSKPDCSPGVKSIGWTSPRGDIPIEYGKSLEIYCNLKKEYKNDPNLTNLYFKADGEVLGPPKAEVTLINSTSKRLYIEKPPLTWKTNYDCYYDRGIVCQNVVQVGVAPQRITDFHCIGRNYEKLTCMWTHAKNYINTTYKLSYMIHSSIYPCDKTEIKTDTENNVVETCTWTDMGTTPYRPSYNKYTFILEILNHFGTLNETFPYNNHENMIMNPPTKLELLSKTPSSLQLQWIVPNGMRLHGGLHHRIQYRSESIKEFVTADILDDAGNEKTDVVTYNLTGLPLPFKYYDIRVSVRSFRALDKESYWSEPAKIVLKTSSTKPSRPPETALGSFETVNSPSPNLKNVYVYWQQLPKDEENGPNFTYIIKVQGHPEIKPVNYTKSYAKIINLSTTKDYVVNIWSANINGTSDHFSSIYLSSNNERPAEPSVPDKKDMGSTGSTDNYYLTWDYPSNSSITNFTIFWCNNDRERPYQCNGLLQWVTVPKDRRSHNQSIPHDNSSDNVYQFAIAANSEKGSSGMVWSECTILHNVLIDKLRDVYVINCYPTSIVIGWRWSCSNNKEMVTGYVINYCPITTPEDDSCTTPYLAKTIEDDSSITSGIVDNLEPYTTYRMTVRLRLKGGTFSQPSRVLLNTTAEGAPTTPLIDVDKSSTTNHSILLVWSSPIKINAAKLRSYHIRYTRLDTNDTNERDTVNTSYELTDLEGNVNYRVNLSACTSKCSIEDVRYFTTKIGYPGNITTPNYSHKNASVEIYWNPAKPANGLNRYRIRIRKQGEEDKYHNVSERKFIFDDCKDGKNDKDIYSLWVSAYNEDGSIVYPGPWSQELNFTCPPSYFGVDSLTYTLIAFAIVIFVGAMFYLAKRTYKYCQIMRDVEVKMPPGLAPVVIDQVMVPWSASSLGKRLDLVESEREDVICDVDIDRMPPADEELLLVDKIKEFRSANGDSSGCSSAEESVPSSHHLSSTNLAGTPDSGTANADNYVANAATDLPEPTSSYVKAGIKTCNGYVTSNFYN